MRRANAIDFWRGLALVMIFVDHMPGHFLSLATMRNFAVCDAAELFVFLAGWSLSYATGGPLKPEPPVQTVLRLTSRAIELYRAQLTITLLALAMLALAAILRNNPVYLEWHNAGQAFFDPVRATIGTVLLTYQLGYFNILPLYIVLLLAAPVFIILARRHVALAIGLSLAIYLFALLTRVSAPVWPSEEQWYFNPLSWQLLLVLGFLAAEKSRSSERLDSITDRLFYPAVAVAIVFLVMERLHWRPDPMLVPEPKLLFLASKTYLSPMRLISLIALLIAFKALFDRIGQVSPIATQYLCGLGRNSLPVFCVLSLLSLAGQILRFIYDESLIVDVLLVLCGLGLMGFTSWFVEWRSRSPMLAQPRSS